MTIWETAQQQEKSWWGNCRNTFGEERKQIVYAQKMGLEVYNDQNSPFVIKSPADRIIDIGCGPVSMLLKLDKLGAGTTRVAIDPCDYPLWVKGRYQEAGILNERYRGEDILIPVLQTGRSLDLQRPPAHRRPRESYL